MDYCLRGWRTSPDVLTHPGCRCIRVWDRYLGGSGSSAVGVIDKQAQRVRAAHVEASRNGCGGGAGEHEGGVRAGIGELHQSCADKWDGCPEPEIADVHTVQLQDHTVIRKE